MQPGQGGMLDALLPALQGYMNAKNQGMSPQDAAIQALGGAVSGAQGTARAGRGSNQIDPGAASATNVIGGIVGALLPSVLGALASGGLGGQTRQPQSSTGGSGGPLTGLGGDPNDPLGGLGGLLGGLLGGSGSGGAGAGAFPGGSNAQGGQSPLGGGLGGLLGGLLGGDGEPEAQPQGGSQDPEPTPGPGDGTRYT
jgi:hypothetical protein